MTKKYKKFDEKDTNEVKAKKAKKTKITQPKRTRKELKALYTRIDEILFYRWDPIGFADSSGPRYEYSMYVNTIFNMMIKGASAKKLAKHLTMISTEWIGRPENKERDKEVATLIHAVVNDLFYYPKFEVVVLD